MNHFVINMVIGNFDKQGMKFKVMTLPSIPYVSKMDLIPGSTDTYEIEGLFPEVFFGLQVLI